MKRRLPKTPEGRRKVLRRRVAIGAAILLTALASPFLFPATVVRLWLNHSAYRDLGARIGSAYLSPAGILELRDLAIDDVQADRMPLLTASKIRLEFSWSGLFVSRCKKITVEGLH